MSIFCRLFVHFLVILCLLTFAIFRKNGESKDSFRKKIRSRKLPHFLKADLYGVCYTSYCCMSSVNSAVCWKNSVTRYTKMSLLGDKVWRLSFTCYIHEGNRENVIKYYRIQQYSTIQILKPLTIVFFSRWLDRYFWLEFISCFTVGIIEVLSIGDYIVGIL